MKTDEQIVKAVKGDRRKGLDLMVGRYGQEIFGMIARQVTDLMDAEELTQDTFLRAFSHIDSYDPQRAALGTWLCRIAYRLTLDFLKRRRPAIVSIEENRPLDECAFIMDATPHALANRLYRIRKKLYKQLQKT